MAWTDSAEKFSVRQRRFLGFRPGKRAFEHFFDAKFGGAGYDMVMPPEADVKNSLPQVLSLSGAAVP